MNEQLMTVDHFGSGGRRSESRLGRRGEKTFFFITARAFERGTPKRTKAAWPEKATTENATCDENIFIFFGNMNNIDSVPEIVEMV